MAPFGGGDAERLEAELDIAEDSQPGEQSIALEHHGDAADRLSNLQAAIRDRALARRHEAREKPQKRRLPRPRFAEDRNDFAVAQGKIDMVEHEPREMVGAAIRLRYGLGTQ
jgi:hypothetical protein